MPKKASTVGGRSKKTRAKAKNITQTVIVNVGKKGGGGKAPSAPPRPTPLQQALQFVQATRQPPQGESLIQSTQVLQRMLEPINRRLDALMGTPPAINMPAINVSQPPINITQPAISFPPINITQPAINIAQPMVKPQASMSSQTEMIPMQSAPLQGGIKPFPPYQLPSAPLSYHDFVLDLPDAPLVKPPQPLVPAGSLRLDPEYEAPLGSDTAKGRLEDVPVVEADEKEQERPRKPIIGEEEAVEVPVELRDDYSRVPLTFEALDKLNVRKPTVSKPLTIEGLYSYYGLPYTAALRADKRQAIANLIRMRGQDQ
jgi:hypothetical protein